jgi:hypothetical protein
VTGIGGLQTVAVTLCEDRAMVATSIIRQPHAGRGLGPAACSVQTASRGP